MVEVMKTMGTSFKRSHAHTATFSVPNPAAGHRWPRPLPELLALTGKSPRLMWGHCSFLLGPGVHRVLFVPSKSLFPQSCVISGSSMVGLMVTSSKRAYAKPRSVAPRAPALRPATADLYTTGDAQTQFWLSVCWLGIHFVPFLCLSSSLRVKLVIFIFIAIVNKKFFHWVYE